MLIWVQAGLWGLLAGGALVVGALIAWFIKVPRSVVATVMAFGAGVLISALAFDLMAEAESRGGLRPTLVGFLGGALVYVAANVALARRGARHRKRSEDQQPSERKQAGSGTAIAIGALLDGVPESIVLGLTLLEGQGVGIAVLAAVFISNLPEAIGSTTGLATAGWRRSRILWMWVAIALVSGAASAAGYGLFQNASPGVLAFVLTFAAGAILTMLANTMMPEAFDEGGKLVGIATTLGFAVAFAIHLLD